MHHYQNAIHSLQGEGGNQFCRNLCRKMIEYHHVCNRYWSFFDCYESRKLTESLRACWHVILSHCLKLHFNIVRWNRLRYLKLCKFWRKLSEHVNKGWHSCYWSRLDDRPGVISPPVCTENICTMSSVQWSVHWTVFCCTVLRYELYCIVEQNYCWDIFGVNR